MKPKTMILMVVAVGCGLVASYLTRQLIRANGQTSAPAEPTVMVVVAKAKVPQLLQIKEPDKQFALVEYPERLAPKRALTNIERLQDQRLNKAVDIDKPVTEDDLLSKDQSGFVPT